MRCLQRLAGGPSLHRQCTGDVCMYVHCTYIHTLSTGGVPLTLAPAPAAAVRVSLRRLTAVGQPLGRLGLIDQSDGPVFEQRKSASAESESLAPRPWGGAAWIAIHRAAIVSGRITQVGSRFVHYSVPYICGRGIMNRFHYPTKWAHILHFNKKVGAVVSAPSTANTLYIFV